MGELLDESLSRALVRNWRYFAAIIRPNRPFAPGEETAKIETAQKDAFVYEPPNAMRRIGAPAMGAEKNIGALIREIKAAREINQRAASNVIPIIASNSRRAVL